MFKLKMMYNNEGDFIDTVYPPMDYARGVQLLNEYRKLWGDVHTYILVSTGAYRPVQDTPMFEETYGG